jgi:hypothetical protein
MVVEFSRRLREELVKLQESTNLRGRAGTSDTGRMSMDSIRSMELSNESGIAEVYDATEAYASGKVSADRSSRS